MERNNFRDRRNESTYPGVSSSGYFPSIDYSNPYPQQPQRDVQTKPFTPPQTAVPGGSPSGYFPSIDYSNPYPQQPQRDVQTKPFTPPLSTFPAAPPPSYSNTTPSPYPGSGFYASAAANSQKAGVSTYGQLPTKGQFSSIQLPTHGAPKKQYGSQMWVPPMPKVTPQERASKKALIIGCNYGRTSHELQGCIADAQNINYMLQTQFGFKKENIRILTDDGKHHAMPTKVNIFSGMDWLVSDLLPGDSLFFHFSGHGSQKPDPTGDERDGLNETLLPCDHAHNGQIIDDDINERLVNRLPFGVYLHAVIDACHSGTAMDLEYYTKYKPGSNFDWRCEGPTVKYKGSSGGVAILFSACADHQVAQDTDTLTGNVYTGAATYTFIQAIVNHGRNSTYAQVLQHMHTTMAQMAGRRELSHGIGGMIMDALANGIMAVIGPSKQSPQISCNQKINLNQCLHI